MINCINTFHQINITNIALIISSTCIVSDIPKFLVEPSSKTVAEDSNITLSCVVKPSNALLSWRYEGDVLEENNSYGFKVFGKELRIPTATLLERQESAFQCVAKTSTGFILSKTATIYKAGKPHSSNHWINVIEL